MTKRIYLGFMGAVAFALTLGLASVSQAGPPTVCGDGEIEGAEICDDGNTIDGDGCSSDCIPEICGDSILEMNGIDPDEECDDGNLDPGDGCDGECNCEPEVCGDGILGCTEECDDGNTIDDDECRNDCTPPGGPGECGDGTVDPGEDCDDGNTIDDDECPNDCMTGGVVACQEGKEGKPAQKCVTSVNKAWGGVIKAVNKSAGKCVKDISKGEVTVSFQDCSGQADTGKAFQKTTSAKTKKCDGKFEGPMCGYIADSQAVNMAGRDPTLGAHYDLLGGDVANIIPKSEKDQAKCQQEVQKGLIKYLDGLSADANKQKKDCVKGTKTCTGADTNSDDLATAMIAEGKKQTKALSKWNTSVGKKCSNTAAIATDFPGICDGSATYTELVGCSARRAKCRFCESLNASDGLSVDCAAYSLDPFNCEEPVDEPECGDGMVEAPETCDDGNTVAGDGCDDNCMIEGPVCGDGMVEAPETCDDGNTVAGDGCDENCMTEPVCGDGTVDPGEDCDDGNTIDDDDCSNICEFTSICGDGVVGPPEECDDGNTIDDDLCTNACLHNPICGDSIVTPDEECDDGNTIDDDLCTNACLHNAMCGDGVTTPPEECDDGNTIAADGCENDCTMTP
jgi:cysteine-rich repeat protein